MADSESSESRKDKADNHSQTSRLLTLFDDLQGEAFRSHDDKPLVCYTDRGRRKTVPLTQAMRFLCLAYYRMTGQAVSSRSKDAVQNLLAAMADDGPKRQTWIRIAEHEGDLYLDLGNEDWSVIRITPNGWSLLDESPVHFLRPSSQLPLPMPERGELIDELFNFVNLPDRKSQALALAWLVSTFRPNRPLPLLMIVGKSGSAKSTTAEILSRIIDPKKTVLRTKPSDAQTVMVGACNGWVLGYDNLSSIPDWLSDLLCCISTGASSTARTLYTDTGETVFEAQRPVILTSIEDVAQRSDLLDRAVILNLPPVEDSTRRIQAEVMADFHKAHGRILGAVLDAVSAALANLPNTRPKMLPRMADFACWAIAAESALGLSPGEYMTAYAENRLDSCAQALEACPIVEPLGRCFANLSEWTGTASDLLDELEKRATKQQREHRRWPKDSTRLSGELLRIAPNLWLAGLEVRQFRESNHGRRRLIQIAKREEAELGQRLQQRHQTQAQLVD